MFKARIWVLAVLLFPGLLCVPARADEGAPPPNLVRSADGKLRPAPGYTWVNDVAGDLRVRWNPGTRHPQIAHIVSGSATGQWKPVAGYNWLNDTPGDLRVRWSPGQRHPDQANVVASSREGDWTPAPGFRWANAIAGDLRVVATSPPTVFPPPGGGFSTRPVLPAATTPAPDEEAVKRAVAKIVGATVAHVVSKPRDDDGLGEVLARALAARLRDELIESAFKDVIPALGERGARNARIVLTQYLDGDLSLRSVAAEAAREELVAQLKKTDPGIAAATDVADILYRVIQTRR